MRPTGARHRPAVATAGAVALACGWAALSAWQGTVSRSSSTARWTTLGVIAAALVVAGLAGLAGRGRQRQRRARVAWRRRATGTVDGSLGVEDPAPALRLAGTVGWVLLIAATIAWDLVSFAAASPHLPTLSRLVGDVTRHDWGRALVFAVWLALGAYLAIGWRRSPADRP